MKNLLIFSLTLIFVAQASIKTVVLVNWKINQQKITELYCVNRNNPMMHCEGKCYLSRQLRKIESDYRESKTPPDFKHLKSVEIAVCPTALFNPELTNSMIVEEIQARGGIYKAPHSSPASEKIFHPPVIS